LEEFIYGKLTHRGVVGNREAKNRRRPLWCCHGGLAISSQLGAHVALSILVAELFAGVSHVLGSIVLNGTLQIGSLASVGGCSGRHIWKVWLGFGEKKGALHGGTHPLSTKIQFNFFHSCLNSQQF
jgi:hypothetical protein